MPQAYVCAADEAVGMREAGDSAVVAETLGAAEGSDVLTQRVIRFGHGRSQPRSEPRHDELLYVVVGEGTVRFGGETHALATGSAVHVVAGGSYVVENAGADDLVAVSVLVPPSLGERGAVIRLADQPEQRADERRTFRVLFGATNGCPEATQFVGYVEPYRAPDHSHPYDEVGFVLAGTGLAHLGADPVPLGPGSCFHLPREHVHCIENLGPGTMQILGVFHPALSPASRSYEAAPEHAATT